MNPFSFSASVETALREQRPMVALESTVITHGLGWPHNLETARRIELVIVDEQAQPATIAVLAGRVTVGLDDAQLIALAQDTAVRKCSIRDLGIVVGMHLNGSTTVAATMFIAQHSGIGVFATGGIGGVHRGHPYDVSTDLTELSRTAVTVVCSGPKALLDLSLTFEHLETLGVPIIGYQTDMIPAFYTRSSGIPADICAESPADVAKIVQAHRALGLPGGELLCVPVPREDELPQQMVDQAITEAHQLAAAQGIHGAATTPFLLSQIARLTQGASVRANISLLLNNARVAAQVANELSLHGFAERD